MCLIGHSHGGEIAIHYAAKHPDRVSALVTVATPSHGGKDADDELAANLELWSDRPWFADAKRQMLGPDPKSDTEAAAQWLAVVPFLFADWDAHAAAYRAAVAVPAWAAPFTVTQPPVDLRPELGAITSPALVIVGAHDFCCGDPAGKDLARGISGAQLERFEHSGHMAYLEEPDQFATAVIAFVSIALEPPRPTSATDERSGRR